MFPWSFSFICALFLVIGLVRIMTWAMSEQFEELMSKEPSALQLQAAASTKPKPPTLGSRGATPLHYRAFSVLRPRITSLPLRDGLVRFRERTKTVKLEDSVAVRDDALRLLDRFILIADEFAPIFDQADADERTALQQRLAATIDTLDQALKDILENGGMSTKRFDVLTRFVELRYAQAEGYALSPA